jgi:hypothetical protein
MAEVKTRNFDLKNQWHLKEVPQIGHLRWFSKFGYDFWCISLKNEHLIES